MARPRLLARVASESLAVSAERGGQVVWSTELSYGAEENLADAMASLAEAVVRQRLPRRMLVIVEPPLVQRRSLADLPPVRQAELTRLVARAAPRFFRQNGHPLVSAAAWAQEGLPPQRVVRAAAIDAEVAEAIVTGARRAGLRLEDILVAGEKSPLSLLPPAERERRQRREWQGVLRLAVMVSALWLVVAVVAGIRLRIDVSQLDAELARLREPRQALLAARQAMDSAGDMLAALDHAQASRTLVATHLMALVKALPDSTFLTSITLDHTGNGTATGRTQGVGGLVEALEATPGLGAVRLEGATVRDTAPGTRWERFSLRLGPERAP
jgi:Fimbrial assembly protein (PilN)